MNDYQKKVLMSEQVAWRIGNEMAQEERASRSLPPLYRFHLALEVAIPNYTLRGPEAQADLISEAETGWQDWFAGRARD